MNTELVQHYYVPSYQTLLRVSARDLDAYFRSGSICVGLPICSANRSTDDAYTGRMRGLFAHVASDALALFHIAPFITADGQNIWHIVLKKYFTFFLICFGIWTQGAFEVTLTLLFFHFFCKKCS